MDTTRPPDPVAAALHYELIVQPQTPRCGWHASLRPHDGGPTVQFDTPLALARYIAQFLEPGAHSRGLR